MDRSAIGRRKLLRSAAIGAGVALLGRSAVAKDKRPERSEAPEGKEKEEEEVSPTEDLMREHGILRRLLLVYGEVVRRIDGNQEVKPELVAQSAHIIRAFIEDYHERDEEEYIFPRFQRAGKLTDLVNVLLAQHRAGRTLTAQIQKLATPAAMSNPASRRELAQPMRQFIRMYEPHAAREDTVLFPAFRSLIGDKELRKLQELFEQKEKALPMGDFEKMVAEVTKIEQALGLYDLAQFTPKS
jgi:hemerythrin-like domain-containing protein